MKLRFAFLCEFATASQGPTNAVGIFDTLSFRRHSPAEQVQVAPYYLVALVECHSGLGPRHLMELNLIDEDGHSLASFEIPFTLGRKMEGTPLSGQVIFSVSAMMLPASGFYSWVLSIDGARVGDVPLIVAELPQTAPAL